MTEEKRKPGRPTTDPSGRILVNLIGKVRKDQAEKVKRVGDGNVSAGLRKLIDAYGDEK